MATHLNFSSDDIHGLCIIGTLLQVDKHGHSFVNINRAVAATKPASVAEPTSAAELASAAEPVSRLPR